MLFICHSTGGIVLKQVNIQFDQLSLKSCLTLNSGTEQNGDRRPHEPCHFLYWCGILWYVLQTSGSRALLMKPQRLHIMVRMYSQGVNMYRASRNIWI